MMRKYFTTIALFVAVLVVGVTITPKSFVFQHEIGLFLWSPDYFRDIFGGALPISTLIGDFLVQFYGFPIVGPLCNALIVTIIFILCRGIAGKFTRRSEQISLILSLVAWFFTAISTTPIIGVAIVLVLCILRLASIPFKKRAQVVAGKRFGLVFIGLAAVIISLSPTVRSLEVWGKIETAARKAEWDKVLKAATVERAKSDRDMVPFALLAAGAKGQLQGAITKYQVRNPGEMDFFGVENRRGYFFQSLLYEQMGCLNEAVHCAFQCGCQMHRGTSFFVLTQLIRYNIELGNYTLVRKYCKVLRQSPAYRATAGKLLKMYEGLEDVEIDGGPSWSTASMIGNPIADIIEMQKCGIDSQFNRDRLAAYATLVERLQRNQ